MRPSKLLKSSIQDFQFDLLVAQSGIEHEVKIEKKAKQRSALSGKK
jgi:hypothetical protein